MKQPMKMLVLGALSTICFSGFACATGFSIPAPIKVDAGPIGKINVQGVVSGFGFLQTNPGTSGGLNGKNAGADISSGLITVSKNSGLIQFNLTAGAYNFPSLGEPFSSTSSTIGDFGALPYAYVTIAPLSNFSVSIGKLPSLLGYTGTFTYERMNIEGGFPWFLQTTVSRGVQVNYSVGPISASVSWNDGYYTNRYNVISGLVTYTINSENSVSVYGMGNAGHTGYANATARYSSNSYVGGELDLNNSQMYGAYYAYTGSNLTVVPEVQYIYTPKSVAFGVDESTDNISAMIHAAYDITDNWSIAAGVDYTHNSSSRAGSFSYGFGYGPGASALGVMITPTYTDGDFFVRDELSYVRLTNYTSGFGADNRPDQLRDILETGFWF
ncbi:outer membrane beta-barrel protein [Acidithiobacillus sp. AMEEHan]|uniref:outer membrane beta-barrel protein n=1 Tax=Acidithiobacillus sp. AMEEHan TaxID=2994951 RepID=UPI0027E3BA90|nr:outer membrane beta-barrel protein [Acidithiobacillus sp. AMEEHan]